MGEKKRLIQFNEIFHRKLTIIRFYRLIIIILKYNNPSDTYSITNDNRNNEKRQQWYSHGEIRVHRGMLKVSLNRARKLNGAA